MSVQLASISTTRGCDGAETSTATAAGNLASEGASPLRQGRASPSKKRGFAPRRLPGGCAPQTPISGEASPPLRPSPDGEV